jgi:hypothetical protein
VKSLLKLKAIFFTSTEEASYDLSTSIIFMFSLSFVKVVQALYLESPQEKKPDYA